VTALRATKIDWQILTFWCGQHHILNPVNLIFALKPRRSKFAPDFMIRLEQARNLEISMTTTNFNGVELIATFIMMTS
jgi:hypothetical protein